jgi:membrane protein YdbS with pleckstrin-like domain
VDDAVAPLPEPTERLPRGALSYWRLELVAQAGGALIAVIVLTSAVGGGTWGWLAVLAVLAVGGAAIALVPPLRHRRWRYAVRDEEIDIRHGTFVVRRTLVPIRRVQHVETESGPVKEIFKLSSVAFFTAAGKTEIPALNTTQAELVRARVAQLARTLDDV